MTASVRWHWRDSCLRVSNNFHFYSLNTKTLEFKFFFVCCIVAFATLFPVLWLSIHCDHRLGKSWNTIWRCPGNFFTERNICGSWRIIFSSPTLKVHRTSKFPTLYRYISDIPAHLWNQGGFLIEIKTKWTAPTPSNHVEYTEYRYYCVDSIECQGWMLNCRQTMLGN